MCEFGGCDLAHYPVVGHYPVAYVTTYNRGTQVTYIYTLANQEAIAESTQLTFFLWLLLFTSVRFENHRHDLPIL